IVRLFTLSIFGATMISVHLNVVGLYYGETIEVDVPNDNPSVIDVLHAAQKVGQTPSGILTYDTNRRPHDDSILWIENDLRGRSNPLESRKQRPGLPRKALQSKVIRLEEGIYSQPTYTDDQEPSVISVAWQYYIEKARKNEPLVTTTYSIDNIIIDAGVSNGSSSSPGKRIEDGDTVTLRLLCINSTSDVESDIPGPLPSRK
ncbi:MAG: hypothetical protein AAGJ83_09620, partial [Planctomycetota bacterium]